MSFSSKLISGVVAMAFAFPAFADGMMVNDSYARSAMKGAKSGAAFMQIVNHTGEDDRLIGVSSPIAKKVELHTHKDQGGGVMKMVHVKDGFEIKAGAGHSLARGGDHVMFMGLNQNLDQGQTVEITLTFEKFGDLVVEVPVDLERQDHGDTKDGEMKDGEMKAGETDHSGMDHSDMSSGN